MARIHYIRHPDLAVICLPVSLLGNPLLRATAVGRGIVAAGTLLRVGGVSLAVRLRRVGRLVILFLGVIGLLVLAVGFFLLLGLGSSRDRGPIRFLHGAGILVIALVMHTIGGPDVIGDHMSAGSVDDVDC